jgi:hypothetical protein
VNAEPTTLAAAELERAERVVALLATEVGARRPTSTAERVAAQVIRDALRGAGVAAELDPFAGYASFGYPYGAIGALAAAPALLPRRLRLVRGALAGLATAALVAEGGLVRTPLSDLLSRRASHNVVATIEPRDRAARTLCLLAHLDSSRSGLLFDPRFAPQLQRWISLQAIATALLPAEPLLARSAAGRALAGVARAISAAGVALLAERELRGVDVPGANDNASGVGVAFQLAAEVAAAPLASTRLVILLTGCEESGLLGIRSFLRRHDTRGWSFVNFDSVGSSATLRYLPTEGVMRRWAADPALVSLAARVARARPELGLAPADGPIGLTYDATAVLAAGGRAITFVAGDNGLIPNYHRPSDTLANVDRETLARAVVVGRELLALIDAGAAD